MSRRAKKMTPQNQNPNIYILPANSKSEAMPYELAEQGENVEQGSPSKLSSGSDSTPLLPLAESKRKIGSPDDPPPTPDLPASTKTQALQLIFGAGGIYAAFLYYGSLQEDVFRYESEDGTKFTMAWYLQVLESSANVVVGTAALIIMGLTGTGHGAGDGSTNGSRKWWGGTPNIPKKPFISSGFSQVCSKGFTSLALANGLSFPVATLAKSGKMAPVMIGSLILGGAKYG